VNNLRRAPALALALLACGPIHVPAGAEATDGPLEADAAAGARDAAARPPDARAQASPPDAPAADRPAPADAGRTDASPLPAGVRDGVRQFVVINDCPQTVWVGVYGTPVVPEGGGFRLDAGQRRTLGLPAGKWSGRVWGRTGCEFDAAGLGGCDTGACGSRERCGGTTGRTPVTLAELTLSGGGADPDFYDLSLVDGYNLPMAIAPLEGTYTRRAGVANDCRRPTCTHDLNATCPAELRYASAAGQVVGCLSACERFKSDEYCCAGGHATPATCPPTSYSKLFKEACPTAYSYAYDDSTSTFTCQGEDYAIWFCP
jgi:hypothetical protein